MAAWYLLPHNADADADVVAFAAEGLLADACQ